MRTFQEQNLRLRPAAGESGPGGLAAWIPGPVAVEADHAPFDALAEPGESAVLDDREMHGAHLAVRDHRLGRAIAARNVVGLPEPYRGFVPVAIGRDDQRR